LGSYFWGQAVLVPSEKENWVFKVTLISAVVNVILNFALIPIWGEIAAAFTTLIAEIIGFICNYWEGRKYVKVNNSVSILIKISIGCLPIVACAVILRALINNMWIYIILTIGISVISYALVEILLKNETIYEMYEILKRKLKIGGTKT
jgi:O-antigen/teichoic acid export membrane protein